MAKKKASEGVTNLFKPTEPAPAANKPGAEFNLDAGRIQATSVGLKTGEVDALDSIAKRYNLKRNSLMRLIIREWLVKYQRGEVSLDQYREAVVTEKWKLPGMD